jgi:hypothetical protein
MHIFGFIRKLVDGFVITFVCHNGLLLTGLSLRLPHQTALQQGPADRCDIARKGLDTGRLTKPQSV